MRLHLALDGEPGVAAPDEWYVSRVCDEFGLSPTQALREIWTAPAGLINDILELRSYAGMVQALEAAKGNGKREAELYATPTGQLVLEVETMIVAWQREQRLMQAETLGSEEG